jgi:exodeoxyribonuclease VII large subunit
MQKLDELSGRLELGIDRQLVRHRNVLATMAATVEALSPLKTLQRGYSICRSQPKGSLVRSIHDAATGDALRTELADGHLESVVHKIVKR